MLLQFLLSNLQNLGLERLTLSGCEVYKATAWNPSQKTLKFGYN